MRSCTGCMRHERVYKISRTSVLSVMFVKNNRCLQWFCLSNYTPAPLNSHKHPPSGDVQRQPKQPFRSRNEDGSPAYRRGRQGQRSCGDRGKLGSGRGASRRSTRVPLAQASIDENSRATSNRRQYFIDRTFVVRGSLQIGVHVFQKSALIGIAAGRFRWIGRSKQHRWLR